MRPLSYEWRLAVATIVLCSTTLSVSFGWPVWVDVANMAAALTSLALNVNVGRAWSELRRFFVRAWARVRPARPSPPRPSSGPYR